jgi:hypothetical protein
MRRPTGFAAAINRLADSLQKKRQGKQANSDAAKSKKTDLPIAHQKYLLESGAPPFRRHKRQETFNDKHDRQCLPEAVAVHRTLISRGLLNASGAEALAARHCYRLPNHPSRAWP